MHLKDWIYLKFEIKIEGLSKDQHASLFSRASVAVSINIIPNQFPKDYQWNPISPLKTCGNKLLKLPARVMQSQATIFDN